MKAHPLDLLLFSHILMKFLNDTLMKTEITSLVYSNYVEIEKFASQVLMKTTCKETNMSHNASNYCNLKSFDIEFKH